MTQLCLTPCKTNTSRLLHKSRTQFIRWAADISQNELVESNDAELILWKHLGRPSPKAAPSAGPAEVSVRTARHGLSKGLAGVTLFVGNRTDAYAADIRLAYEAEVLTPVAVEPTASGVLLAANLAEEGRIIVASASQDGLVGADGGMFTFRFRTAGKQPGHTALRLERIALFDAAAAPIGVRLAGESSLLPRTVPSAYVLSHGHPNPFNPSTELRVRLPVGGDVAVAVYNLSGQVVRKLVNGRMEAGEWPVVWDGRDGRGRMVPSGVYVVGMKAGQQVVARKVTLIK